MDLPQMDILIFPTLNTSMEHEVETPHASSTYVHAPIINDQQPNTCAIDSFHRFFTILNHEHTNNDNGI
jgi:hypothetical protein